MNHYNMDTIPFGNYVSEKNKDILTNLDLVGLTIKIIGVNPNQSCTEGAELYFQRTDVQKLMNKSVPIKHFSKQHFWIENQHYLSFKDWSYELFIHDKKITLEEAYALLQEKDISTEIQQLMLTKTKNDTFFNFGSSGIIKHYVRTQELANEFKSLFVNSQFSLPDDPQSLQNLLETIEKDSQGAKIFILENIPTKSERLARQATPLKQMRI